MIWLVTIVCRDNRLFHFLLLSHVDYRRLHSNRKHTCVCTRKGNVVADDDDDRLLELAYRLHTFVNSKLLLNYYYYYYYSQGRRKSIERIRKRWRWSAYVIWCANILSCIMADISYTLTSNSTHPINAHFGISKNKLGYIWMFTCVCVCVWEPVFFIFFLYSLIHSLTLCIYVREALFSSSFRASSWAKLDTTKRERKFCVACSCVIDIDIDTDYVRLRFTHTHTHINMAASVRDCNSRST